MAKIRGMELIEVVHEKEGKPVMRPKGEVAVRVEAGDTYYEVLKVFGDALDGVLPYIANMPPLEDGCAGVVIRIAPIFGEIRERLAETLRMRVQIAATMHQSFTLKTRKGIGELEVRILVPYEHYPIWTKTEPRRTIFFDQGKDLGV